MKVSDKFKSRKFIAFVAAFCASLGGSLVGAFSGNSTIVIVGMVLIAFSSGCYQLTEGYVDGKAASANTTTTTKNVTATAESSTIVKNAFNNQEL